MISISSAHPRKFIRSVVDVFWFQDMTKLVRNNRQRFSKIRSHHNHNCCWIKINETLNLIDFQTIWKHSRDINRWSPIPASSFDMPIWTDISSVQAWTSELHWIKCANSNSWRYSTSCRWRDIPWTKFPNNCKTWNGKKSNSIKLEPSLTYLKGVFKDSHISCRESRRCNLHKIKTPILKYNFLRFQRSDESNGVQTEQFYHHVCSDNRLYGQCLTKIIR